MKNHNYYRKKYRSTDRAIRGQGEFILSFIVLVLYGAFFVIKYALRCVKKIYNK